jgi:hypothetical protein
VIPAYEMPTSALNCSRFAVLGDHKERRVGVVAVHNVRLSPLVRQPVSSTCTAPWSSTYPLQMQMRGGEPGRSPRTRGSSWGDKAREQHDEDAGKPWADVDERVDEFGVGAI